MTSFKENSEIVVYKEPYRVFLREITNRLRNNRWAPVTKLHFLGGSFWEDAEEQIGPRIEKAQGELIKQTKETTLETLARTVSGCTPENIKWDEWQKQRSYFRKVFDFVTGKEEILEEKREGKQKAGEENSHGFIDFL